MAKKQVKKVREVPVGVKVIAVLYYIAAVLYLLGGILAVAGAGAVGAFFGPLGAGAFVGLGIVSILLAILGFFVGRGLWRMAKWARIVAMVLAAIGVIFGILGLVAGGAGSGILQLLISGGILYYLGFSKECKQAFA